MDSQVLSIFVSSVFLCLASSTVSSTQMLPTETQSLNQQLQKTSVKFQRGYLYLTLAAASTGRNFVRVPEPVTKNCTKIASAIMNLHGLPSTHQTTVSVLDRSVDKIINTSILQTNQSLIEVLCDHLNVEARLNQSQNFNFEAERMKSWPVTPNESENYFIDIPQNQTVDQYMKSGSMMFMAYAKQLIKFGTIRAFYMCENEKSFVKHRECMGAASAILQLSRHKNHTIRENVDKMFVNAFDEYFKTEVYSESMDEYLPAKTDYAADFAKRLSTEIRISRTNPVEKQLYEKIENEVIGKSKTGTSASEKSNHQHEL